MKDVGADIQLSLGKARLARLLQVGQTGHCPEISTLAFQHISSVGNQEGEKKQWATQVQQAQSPLLGNRL